MPSASLLPNGKQQFLDQNGHPLASGSVYFYIPNTTTFKATWQDSNQTTENTNPVVLDAAGEALIYGSGQYRQVVKDVFGTTIWDELTDTPIVSTDIGQTVQAHSPNLDVLATVVPGAFGKVLLAEATNTSARTDMDVYSKEEVTALISNSSTNVRKIPNAAFNYLNNYGSILACAGPGQAVHNIDIEEAWKAINRITTGTFGPNNQPTAGDSFVSPSGSDSNIGTSPFSPFLTIAKGFQNTSNTVWLLPGVYRDAHFSLFVADNKTPSGAPRAVRIRALDGPGSVLIIGPGKQPNEVTWTADPTYANTYDATLTGSPGSVLAFIRLNSDGSYTPVPYVSNLSTSAYCWTASGGGSISVRGIDMTQAANQTGFAIIYQYTAPASLNGCNVLMSGLDFRGWGLITAVFDPTGNVRPMLHMKDCSFSLSDENGLHTEGGLIVTQNVTAFGSGADNFNYYDDNVRVGGTGQKSEALEIDNVSEQAGYLFATGGTPATRNNQGSSTHDSGTVICINGKIGAECYGQGIAHTGAAGYRWLVGTEVPSPYANVSGTTLDGFQALEIEGTAWFDTVMAGGTTSQYGLDVEGATLKTYNCTFVGYAGNILQNGGTITPYTPNNP